MRLTAEQARMKPLAIPPNDYGLRFTVTVGPTAMVTHPGNHMWFVTDGRDLGLGAADAANPPGAGPYVLKDNSPVVSQTAVVDHSTRRTPSTVCTPFPNVQAACARRMVKVGDRHGRWMPFANDCRSLVFGVITLFVLLW